jgi:hypothetical protein
MSVVFVVFCVGSSLCDEVITHSEESSCVCMCLIVCDKESSRMWRPRSKLFYYTTEVEE